MSEYLSQALAPDDLLIITTIRVKKSRSPPVVMQPPRRSGHIAESVILEVTLTFWTLLPLWSLGLEPQGHSVSLLR